MAVDFLPNENVLFKHLAKSGKSDGEVVVTDIRLIFLPKDSKDTKSYKELAWANIDNIDYTKPNDERTALRIKTVFEGDKIVIIQLSKEDTNARIAEYLRMKDIISQIRKSKAVAKEVTKSKLFEIDENRIGQLKEQLLQADKTLANQFKELVGGKILSEEEFWSSHADLLYQCEVEQIQKSNRKGTKNFVLSDAMHQDEDGNVNINLTVELKELIFLKYPVVRTAFDAEVPLYTSESDFWQKFFKFEFFNKTDQGHKESISQNQFFAKYAITEQATVNLLKKSMEKKRFSVPINTAVDLTATFGDYYSRNDSEPVDESLGVKNTTSIIQRCNEDSNFVLTAVNLGVQQHLRNENEQNMTAQLNDEAFPELKNQEPQKFQKVDLSKLLADPTADSNESNGIKSPKSVFKKSDKILGKRKIELTAQDFQLKPLSEYVPTSQRAEKVFTSEITRITRLESIRNHSTRNNTLPESDEAFSSLIPDDIRQVLTYS
jgi:hypothetical protein